MKMASSSAAAKTFMEEDDAVYESYSISDFFQVLGFKLYYESPKYTFQPWVFGSQDEQRPLSPRIGIPEKLTNCRRGFIKEKIISGLRKFTNDCHTEILIQFWEPITVRGRCCLTTLDQPFVLSNIHKGFCDYRRHSLGYIIDVEGEKSDEEVGLHGRVFRHKLLESTPDVSYYSSKEYPLRDLAVRCGVVSSSALPVFEPYTGQSCVGVLELVSTGVPYIDIKDAYSVLQKAGLRSSGVNSQISMPNWRCRKDAEDKIKEVLEVVCKKHKLPLALAWAPHWHSFGVDDSDTIRNSCNSFDLSGNEEVMTIIDNAFYGDDGLKTWVFRMACRLNHLRKGQGLVGKAFLSRKPSFCRDVTQFSIIEYPLAHFARWCELTGCFAISLQSTSTGNINYVLELFLPPSNTQNNGDPETLLEPVVATMTQHFRSFLVAGELGDELSVIQSSANDEPDSLKICQTTTSYPRPEALQIEREAVEADSSHQQLVVPVEDDILDRRDVGGVELSNIAVTCLDHTCKAKTSNRACKYSISYEVIQEQQLLGVKIDDAAYSLGVGRSTLKRICREYGLEDWRVYRKRKKVNRPPSDLKQTTDSVQAGNERNPKSSRSDPLGSELPPKQTLTNVTPMKDVSTVTIKGKYKDITIKFQFSSSSGMAELVENITERLGLLKGRAFSIKYQDDEDDWILIACDKDLQECMGSSRSLPDRTPIRILIDQPINDEAL